MNNTTNTDSSILDSFLAIQSELVSCKDSKDLNMTAATLVLATQIKNLHNDLNRIAKVLGADQLESSKIAQSDTPDTMLSLLTALKATQSP